MSFGDSFELQSLLHGPQQRRTLVIYTGAAAIIERQGPASEQRINLNAASRRSRGRFKNKKCTAFANDYSIPGKVERAARLFGFLMKADYTGRLQLFQKQWLQRCFRPANKHCVRFAQKNLLCAQANGHGCRRASCRDRRARALYFEGL